MADWSEQFKSLLSSPLGEELLRELNVRHDLLVKDAEDAQTQETAFGLLKQAAGVIKAVEHLKFLAVAPTDEGGKVKN